MITRRGVLALPLITLARGEPAFLSLARRNDQVALSESDLSPPGEDVGYYLVEEIRQGGSTLDLVVLDAELVERLARFSGATAKSPELVIEPNDPITAQFRGRSWACRRAGRHLALKRHDYLTFHFVETGASS